MSITVVATPGKIFGSTEKVDNDKLNQLGQPTFVISGTVQASDVAAGAVTSAKTTVGPFSYATGAFSTGVYTLTFTSATAPASLVDGLEVWFKAASDNTGATQINVGVGGNVTLYKNISQALVAGDIIAGQMVGIRYNSAIPAPISAAGWQMVTAPLLPDSFSGTTAGTAPNYTMTITPPVGANALTLASLDGRPIVAKIHSASVGSDDLAVTLGTTALAAKPIKKHGNVTLAAGDLKANQKATLVYSSDTDTYQLQNPSSNTIDPPAIVASGRNVSIANDGVSPNSKMVVTADEVVLKTASGVVYLASSVNVTIDMGGTPGTANALDTGAEAANTTYYMWLLYNGTAVAGVFSVSSTSPNLSSGGLTAYTYKAMVGAVRNDNSSNFFRTYISDRQAWLTEQAVLVGSGKGSADTWQILDNTSTADLDAFRAAVPPIAKTCFGFAGSNDPADNVNLALGAVNSDGTLASTVLGPILIVCSEGTVAAYGSFDVSLPFSGLPVRGGASNNIQWKSRLNTLAVSLSITGYTF